MIFLSELVDVRFFYWVRTTFLLKKCMNLMFLMNALPDRPTNRPTDRAYYRDARTHLKKVIKKRENEAGGALCLYLGWNLVLIRSKL